MANELPLDFHSLVAAVTTTERREHLQTLLHAAHRELSTTGLRETENDPDARALTFGALDQLEAALRILPYLPQPRQWRIYSDDERDQAFARLQAIDQELGHEEAGSSERDALEHEREGIAIGLDRSVARLGPYPPWAQLLAAEREAAERAGPPRKSGRTSLPLKVVRDVMLRGLVAYFSKHTRGAPLPKQWQLCSEITDSRLRGGKVHPKTLSRWLSDHGSNYQAMLRELEPEARRRAIIGSARDEVPHVTFR